MFVRSFSSCLLQANRVLEGLQLDTVERKARFLGFQLASLCLLAYSDPLSKHRDSPMFGHISKFLLFLSMR
jgi:hypothetical protein